MPFFNEQPWMTRARRVWVWVLLTVPSTLFAVLFYYLFTRRNLAAGKKRHRSDVGDEEMETLDSADGS